MTLPDETQEFTAYQSLAEYAARPDTPSERTVKRWLAAGELSPAPYRDGRNRWMIPANAVHMPAPQEDANVTLHGTVHSASGVARIKVEAPNLDLLPSFLTLEQAAHILGITTYAIREHKDYFNVVAFGPRGALLVPLATIKRIRG